MPCTGLGHEARGFETFTRALSDALRGSTRVALTVYGGGDALRPGEHRIRCLRRSSTGARLLGGLTGRSPYFIEQLTFAPGFMREVARTRPDVVYFADLNLGNLLWHWRRATGRRFALVYYNGGATTMPYTRCDHVQQTSPEHEAAALARGERAEHMSLLPHGLAIPATLPARDPARVAATRAAWRVPPGRSVLLSVGMLDATIKRMDALTDGVAELPAAERPHLVLLGARSPETPRIAQLAHERLGDGVTLVDRWNDMPAAYEAADAFALLSRREGFGMAWLEATAAGLPCVAHESPTARYVLGDDHYFGDTTRASETAALVRRALADDPAARARRHARARAEFGWESLAPRYEALLSTAAVR